MTDKQRLELRQSELRGKLAELAAAEGTDETRSEINTLGSEYTGNEARLRAFAISADTPLETRSNEDTQRQELRDKANVGQLMFDLLNGRATSGAMAEYQKEFGLADNEISIRMLADTEHANPEHGLETRAVTGAPTNVGQNQQAIVPYVFPQSVAAYLGIDMPTVGVGEAVFPVLTSELTVGTPAENAAAAETTGAFNAEVLSPARLQASFFYSREDRARFANMDAALRENLSMGLADGLDKQIIAGTNGLLTATNLANNNVTTATTFDLYMSQLAYGRVDGRYAGATGDIRLVMGSAVYAHAGATYRNTSVDRTVLDRLQEVTNGTRVSAHVPAEASNRQNAIVRLGMRRDMVAAVWENVAFIPDEITKAANGQIVVTAIMLHAVKIVRTAGFHKQQIQTA